MSGLEIVEGDIERASNSIGDVAAATGVDPPADRPSAGRRGRMHARMEWAVPAWSDILHWDHHRSRGDRGLVAQMATADTADGARGVDTAEHVPTRAPGIGDESGRRPGEPRRPGGTLPKTLRGGRRNTMMRRISRRRWGAIALGAVPAFGVTACSARKGNGMFDQVEGAKPLEERQTIEDHRAAVEVQLGRVDPASTRTPAPPPPSGPGAEFTSALPGSEKRR